MSYTRAAQASVRLVLVAIILTVIAGVVIAAAEDRGKIMRPADKSVIASGPVDIVATAPGGVLELDGARIEAKARFPDVLHATVEPKPGTHTLSLIWEGGRKDIRFHTGPNSPAGFEPFRHHPPGGGAECTQCHELSRRGRFVFKGGCFDCHQDAAFAKVHTHTAEVLRECGLCHNAHGSTAAKHLLYTKEIACKQCHN